MPDQERRCPPIFLHSRLGWPTRDGYHVPSKTPKNCHCLSRRLMLGWFQARLRQELRGIGRAICAQEYKARGKTALKSSWHARSVRGGGGGPVARAACFEVFGRPLTTFSALRFVVQTTRPKIGKSTSTFTVLVRYQWPCGKHCPLSPQA